MALIGYARVSTDEQTTDPQLDALGAAGCTTIHREHASGGDRSRPELKRAIERCRAGDVLVVVRIDRLARSLAHLLEIIEALDAKRAGFRSLGDPIDTPVRKGGSLQESDRYVRQIGTDTNASHAASNDCLFLSSRSSPGPGRSPVSQA